MSQGMNILIIDDEESICYAFKRYFEARGFSVATAATGRVGTRLFAAAKPDVVFLDVRLGDADGIDVLEELRRLDPAACVIIITAFGTLETVARAMSGKAFDFLVKPLDLDQAALLVTKAAALRSAVLSADGEVPLAAASTLIVGSSAPMQEVYKRVGMVAQTDSAVLISGATGTGKELVARAIHAHGRRSEEPFVAVNCAALPENLVESELFGYARGAFTGAGADKPGRFEADDGGTLFLDEIGDLPLPVQVKLLRFLDNQVIERLGTVEPIHLDVRIIAATNRDLASAIEAGKFRSDLYYRLAVFQIELPPLKERRADILPLARHFLRQSSAAGATVDGQKPPATPPLTQAVVERLLAYGWPGNVRELRNAIEYAAVVSGGGPILPAHLPQSVLAEKSSPTAPPDQLEQTISQYLDLLGNPEHLASQGGLYQAAMAPLERAVIRHALAQSGGNQTEAAKLLGLHRNTLRNKLRELGIEAQD